ncbi:DUF5821 family protein [Halobaculum sp. MBLA0147]|uniref:transcriptional regulator TbsP domain-containing protein n=1 Tax=Halobaculum sp. MBLA0147 TaxID=3079934 RepID=UPI003526B3C8
MAHYIGDEAGVELLTELLAELHDDALLVDPSASVLAALGEVETDTFPPTLDVLARESVLKTVRDDFLVASNLADHIAADRLTLRVFTGTPETTILATPEIVYAIVGGEGLQPVALSEDDASVTADVCATYREQFGEAESFNLRTPGRLRALERLGADVGTGVREDLETILGTLAEVSDETIDEVTLALLVAARNEAQLYTIGHWGEDVGLASRATFSRMKTDLEDAGLITTEKVPTDVGRPRLRLLLADDELVSADLDTFADVAQRKL